MEFAPSLQIGWLNGWLPLAGFYLVFGVMMALFPRSVVARLYDLPKYTGRAKLLWIIGRVIAVFILFGLLLLSPLKIGEPVFIVGAIVYLIGFVSIVWALFTYRNTPLDQPVVDGLYRVSRNPQVVGLTLMFLGCSIAVGAWIAVLTWGVMVSMNHVRIVGEEQLCLAQYGESYREYMARVPRYLIFF